VRTSHYNGNQLLVQFDNTSLSPQYRTQRWQGFTTGLECTILAPTDLWHRTHQHAISNRPSCHQASKHWKTRP